MGRRAGAAACAHPCLPAGLGCGAAARRPTQPRAARPSGWRWRAVPLQPQIIPADEPTASLDDRAAEQAVALLYASAQALAATLVVAGTTPA